MKTSVPAKQGQVIVLIATSDRPRLLTCRALPSVFCQTVAPDRIVLIDDSKEELSRKINHRWLRRHAPKVEYLCNRRTLGLSGALNSGLDHCLRTSADPSAVFIAILDDDDAWEPDHLALCLQVATEGDLNMVASGLIRHEEPTDAGHKHSIPDHLDARELFIRGQHIQGSNLFVRLDSLLLAGTFDEHLPSCTDRDLCIRLSELDTLRFGPTNKHTVHHFADPRGDRLSTSASPSKLAGLTHFWEKYALRFDVLAREEFSARALDRFGWTLPETKCLEASIPPLLAAEQSLDLIVGFITDSNVPARARGLLEDLLGLCNRSDLKIITVVVIENGPLPDDGTRPLQALVHEFQERGLSIQLISIEQQRNDWVAGELVDTPNPALRRLPIAVSRTVLNTYIARAARSAPGAAAWILDDDKRLSVGVELNGEITRRLTPDVKTLLELRNAGVDVVIGPDTGAAPLPFMATLRLQLLDAESMLRTMVSVDPGDQWPDRNNEESVKKRRLKDWHYDLSRQTEHLETSLWISPQNFADNWEKCLAHLSSKVGRLLAGESVFRPLLITPKMLATDAAFDSTQRGGSTIFFDPRHLVAYPQSLARLGEQYVRRSDMLVTSLMEKRMGLKIVMHASAGVWHDRSDTTQRSEHEHSVLQADVLGYALYRALNELLDSLPTERLHSPLFDWQEGELAKAVKLIRKYLEERLAALALSSWRIYGLSTSIQGIVAKLMTGDSNWASPCYKAQLAQIADEMAPIIDGFTPGKIDAFSKAINTSITDADIRHAYMSMDALIGEYRSTLSIKTTDEKLDARIERSRALLARAYGVTDARVLGAGGEGVAFTDNHRVFKILDILKERPNHDTLETLKALGARLITTRHLYVLERVEVHENTLIIVYPFEASEAYVGGYGPQFISLLRECKRSGIVFRNMHPKNLRISGTGLRLIDYGSDIRPYSEGGYRSMAERAWLTWRWWNRPDLEELMRCVLTDDSIPEMEGFGRFWAALIDERPSATRIVSEMVDPVVLKSGARSVLDYGCGKKAFSALHLAQAGLACTGYDPGLEMPEKWTAIGERPANFSLTTDRELALSNGPYDAVVSSLVLCELEDGDVFEQVLDDIRSSVKSGGVAVITVCNPLSTFGPPTNLHYRRDLPTGVTYEDSFWLTENAVGCLGRKDYHRSLRRFERHLLRHGLRVEKRIASETIDIERFEPASDFLTLVCRPVLDVTQTTQVSLLIKTCAMEAATLERQVSHLTRQLEGPRAFCERILVVESLADGFVRQHASADLNALIKVTNKLIKEDYIDRVICGPEVEDEVRRVMRDWFGCDCTATHSKHGAPLAAPLWAIEQCAGEYILQVDSDLLIRRNTHRDDYLGKMITALECTPNAITASLSVTNSVASPFTAAGERGTWRVESRGCLLHKSRLLEARPFPNVVTGETLDHSWHRSMDQAVQQGRICSLRGAQIHTGFIHPSNGQKQSVADWMLWIDLVERVPVPDFQLGKVDLVGVVRQWVPQNRSERFIFMITGRNVPPGRIRRCIDSVSAQTLENWGAIIVDDGSASMERMSAELAVAPFADRITLIQPRERRGQLANMVLAISQICTDPESVIITLDLDDALIGPNVLERLDREYSAGADVTVGSMLRTDKKADYPVVFQHPRKARGGNVWQHLRSFKKRLFDAIPDEDLRIDGSYVDIAVDWSFMLPIVEMASKPVWIQEKLYFYEPSGMGKGADRDLREAQITAIVAKPSIKETKL